MGWFDDVSSWFGGGSTEPDNYVMQGSENIDPNGFDFSSFYNNIYKRPVTGDEYDYAIGDTGMDNLSDGGFDINSILAAYNQNQQSPNASYADIPNVNASYESPNSWIDSLFANYPQPTDTYVPPPNTQPGNYPALPNVTVNSGGYKTVGNAGTQGGDLDSGNFNTYGNQTDPNAINNDFWDNLIGGSYTYDPNTTNSTQTGLGQTLSNLLGTTNTGGVGAGLAGLLGSYFANQQQNQGNNNALNAQNNALLLQQANLKPYMDYGLQGMAGLADIAKTPAPTMQNLIDFQYDPATILANSPDLDAAQRKALQTIRAQAAAGAGGTPYASGNMMSAEAENLRAGNMGYLGQVFNQGLQTNQNNNANTIAEFNAANQTRQNNILPYNQLANYGANATGSMNTALGNYANLAGGLMSQSGQNNANMTNNYVNNATGLLNALLYNK